MTLTSTEQLPATQAKAPAWAWIVGTFFGAGFGRPGPGTWASVATSALWLTLARFADPESLPLISAITAVAVTALGIPAATRVARALGKKDPSQVVIDEVAGQMIAFIAVPLNWHNVLAALILFRVFDITKPFPIRRLERLPEGTGIMLDDVGAGLYALAVMQVLLHFGVLK
ncbi:MAG TPA: phosphatidylglycerophosphatase A [Terriglobales bacterium]|nr:phosphatidylglycerophosphatase A [Terriglobales bacterium]